MSADPELARLLLAAVTNAPQDRQDDLLIQAGHAYDLLTNPKHPRRCCRCREARKP